MARSAAGYPQRGGIVPSIHVIRGTGRNAKAPHVKTSKKGEYGGVRERAPPRSFRNGAL